MATVVEVLCLSERNLRGYTMPYPSINPSQLRQLMHGSVGTGASMVHLTGEEVFHGWEYGENGGYIALPSLAWEASSWEVGSPNLGLENTPINNTPTRTAAHPGSNHAQKNSVAPCALTEGRTEDAATGKKCILRTPVYPEEPRCW